MTDQGLQLATQCGQVGQFVVHFGQVLAGDGIDYPAAMKMRARIASLMRAGAEASLHAEARPVGEGWDRAGLRWGVSTGQTLTRQNAV